MSRSNVDVSTAVATQDGELLALSSQSVDHPVYNTPAYEAKVRFEISAYQHELALCLEMEQNNRNAQTIARSAPEQLGVFSGGFAANGTDPLFEVQKITEDSIEIATYVTTVDSNADGRMLQSLQSLMLRLQNPKSVKDSTRPKIMRLFLAHPEAKVTVPEPRLLKLLPEKVVYDSIKFSNEELESIWLGTQSGREVLLPKGARKDVERKIQPGSFIVGEVSAMKRDDPSSQHFWLIERVVLDEHGNPTAIRHGEAALFDPMRSIGLRQIEVVNIGAESVASDSLYFQITEYHPDILHSNGAQMTGV